MRPAFHRPIRSLTAAATLALFAMTSASAVTLTNGLKGQKLDQIYGSYAPHGDCSAEPRLTIDDAGFTFHVNGRTLVQSKVEYAVSYLGPDYNGIEIVFFPFPVSDNNFGPVLMTVNDGSKRGTIRFDADLEPGKSADPIHAAITGASPFTLCRAPTAARNPVPM